MARSGVSCAARCEQDRVSHQKGLQTLVYENEIVNRNWKDLTGYIARLNPNTPMTLRILLALAFISILFSCGKDDDSDPNPSQQTPTFLKVGTKYTMYVDDGFWNQDTLKTVVDKQLATDTFLIRNYSETIATAYTQYWVLKDND